MRAALCLTACLAAAWPCHADQPLGVTSLDAPGGDPARTLSLTIWYPAEGGAPDTVGGNAVFVGETAGRDAPFTPARLPVAVVSHGGLRSAPDSGAWLSAGLARAGYIAVEVNAPPPTTGAEGVNEIWRRPGDVSRAFDALLSHPDWSGRIDPAQVSVVGFALGGTAALALAGGEFAPEAFARVCDAGGSGPDCAWFQAQGVTLDLVDAAELATPRRDPRITSAVAIKPEYLEVFAQDMTTVVVPALVIALGVEGGPQTTAATPLLDRSSVPDTDAFDGFGACTAAGPDILAEEDADPALCGVSAEARARAHRAILDQVLTFLRSAPAEPR
jgi:predicted dienelactone hydrolase